MSDTNPTTANAPGPNPADANPAALPKAPVQTRAQRVLASLVAGAGVDDISTREKITRQRTETILRDELRRRWVAPAHEYARLQIARLDSMILRLIDRVQKSELRAIDRALKILDRLDRYHGFVKAERAIEPYGDEERARLMKKLNDVAARLDAEKPQE
jgi:hypothetical protein